MKKIVFLISLWFEYHEYCIVFPKSLTRDIEKKLRGAFIGCENHSVYFGKNICDPVSLNEAFWEDYQNLDI